MNGLLVKQNDESLSLDVNYKNFLQEIKDRLKRAQIRAALAANTELVRFYWELGNELIEKQKQYSWGEKFLEQFSRDLRAAFPEMRGFSVTNLKVCVYSSKVIQKVHKLWTNYLGVMLLN